MNVCRQTGAGMQFLFMLIFACVVLRKVRGHSLFTLETVGFPKGLLFLA